ncbi:MAG: glutaredoxin domain-containing protein [Poseidonibacter sp.]
MKKIFILCFFISLLITGQAKEFNSVKDMPSNKDIFLMFSIPSCPWCERQEKVLKKIKESRDDFEYMKVQDDNIIYEELIQNYAFPIEVYPTSFIVNKEEGKLHIKYEFQGYQKRSSILKILDSDEEF